MLWPEFPSSLRPSNIPIDAYTPSCLSIHCQQPVGLLLLWAIMTTVAMNMGAQTSLQDPGFNSSAYTGIPPLVETSHWATLLLQIPIFARQRDPKRSFTFMKRGEKQN